MFHSFQCSIPPPPWASWGSAPRRPCWERRAPAPCSPPPSRCRAAAARTARRRPREPWRRATAASPRGSPGRSPGECVTIRGTVEELFINTKWGFIMFHLFLHLKGFRLGMNTRITHATKPQAIGLPKEVRSLQFSRICFIPNFRRYQVHAFPAGTCPRCSRNAASSSLQCLGGNSPPLLFTRGKRTGPPGNRDAGSAFPVTGYAHWKELL